MWCDAEDPNNDRCEWERYQREFGSDDDEGHPDAGDEGRPDGEGNGTGDEDNGNAYEEVNCEGRDDWFYCEFNQALARGELESMQMWCDEEQPDNDRCEWEMYQAEFGSSADEDEGNGTGDEGNGTGDEANEEEEEDDGSGLVAIFFDTKGAGWSEDHTPLKNHDIRDFDPFHH